MVKRTTAIITALGPLELLAKSDSLRDEILVDLCEFPVGLFDELQAGDKIEVEVVDGDDGLPAGVNAAFVAAWPHDEPFKEFMWQADNFASEAASEISDIAYAEPIFSPSTVATETGHALAAIEAVADQLQVGRMFGASRYFSADEAAQIRGALK